MLMAGACLPSPFAFGVSTHHLPISPKPGKAHSSLRSGGTAGVQVQTLKRNNKEILDSTRLPGGPQRARPEQRWQLFPEGRTQIHARLSTAPGGPQLLSTALSSAPLY